ncbi:MAG: hypothetical protein KJ626_04110 [Verrucomicrobia bacterium]|nr:hypothetical protein [Verrucomicrobiota bacterium]
MPIFRNDRKNSYEKVLLASCRPHNGHAPNSLTVVAAIFYTLIESAKFCGVNPKEYLLAATKAALEVPGTVLIPHQYRVQVDPAAGAIFKL